MANRKRVQGVSKAGGVGGGMALVGLARSLPEQSPWKPWILFAAPTISVVLSETFSAISFWIADWWHGRIQDKAYQEAKRIADEQLVNSKLPEDYKDHVRINIGEIEKTRMNNALERFRMVSDDQEERSSFVRSTSNTGERIEQISNIQKKGPSKGRKK